MRVLVPLLTLKESDAAFIEAFTAKVDEVVLLQIVDKEFMSRTSSAIGEVSQYRAVMEKIKKAVSAKKKKCVEVSEWGGTIKKILALAFLRKIDKVFLVKQNTQFFDEILAELKKAKIKVEIVEVADKEPEEDN